MSIFPVQGQRDSPRPFEEERQQKRGVTNVARSKFNLVAHQLCDLRQVSLSASASSSAKWRITEPIS